MNKATQSKNNTKSLIPCVIFLLAFGALPILFGNIQSLQNTKYNLLFDASRTAKTTTSPFHDACMSHSNTSLSKQLVDANAVDISFKMSLYGFENGVMDIVSRSIARDKVWEKAETEEMMSLFPCREGMECENGKDYTKRFGTLLDVGANIGWYSLVAAHLGHNVISFEPFNKNVDLICSSKAYLPPEKTDNWRLYQLGLDYKQRQCQLFQMQSVNIGDTHSVCDEKSRQSFIAAKFDPLGWMNTTTLDYALQLGVFDDYPQIDVMKIDVEGFEPKVFAGANSFFESEYAPKHIFMEFNSRTVATIVGQEDAMDFMKSILIHLKNHGYELLERPGQAFAGLSLQNDTLNGVVQMVNGRDLMFVHLGS